MIKLKPIEHNRLALLWVELRDAEAAFTIASHVVDEVCAAYDWKNASEHKSTLRTGVGIVGDGEGMRAVESASNARERAVSKWVNAQTNLRTGYVEIIGGDADGAITQLLAAIEACYAESARYLRTQLTGSQGMRALDNVQAAMNLINNLVEGDPVMVDTVPAAHG